MPTHVTPSVASDLLARYRLRAGIRHGQHFLVDPNTVRKIVRLAAVRDDETILEIGPGLGSLTVELARSAARVVAIEIDRFVIEALREVVGDVPNVELVAADAMRTDIDELVAGRARLVANLPYNVATPLFVRVLADFPRIEGGLVMVQRELGERWTAGPATRAYGAVTLRVSYHCDARIVADVPPTVFMPPPKVASVLVAFARRERPPVDVPDEAGFFSFVQSAFAHRRKTLRNSLMAAGYDKADVVAAMDAVGVADQARPEDLDLVAFARLHSRVTEDPEPV